MSKNTRWALALVGVVIIIIGAFVIGTGKDNTDAVQEPKSEATAETGPTQSSPVTPQTGSTGAGNGGDSNSGSGSESGGASPDESGGDSGGASPGESNDQSGGAPAQIGVLSPVLTVGKTQTIRADKGEVVVIRAKASSTGEMHVHGYDKEVPLKPGEVVRVKFKATIDGEFPIEFHLPAGDHADVGTLRVSP